MLPITVDVESSFQLYGGGVYVASGCTTTINHAMVAVGYMWTAVGYMWTASGSSMRLTW